MSDDTLPVVTENQKYEIQVSQTKALQELSNAVTAIAHFFTSGGIQKLAQSLAISNSANSLLNGLTAHDGRKGLDARTINQNALEIAELVLAVHTKFQERLSEKRDPEVHEPTEEYKPR